MCWMKRRQGPKFYVVKGLVFSFLPRCCPKKEDQFFLKETYEQKDLRDMSTKPCNILQLCLKHEQCAWHVYTFFTLQQSIHVLISKAKKRTGISFVPSPMPLWGSQAFMGRLVDQLSKCLLHGFFPVYRGLGNSKFNYDCLRLFGLMIVRCPILMLWEDYSTLTYMKASMKYMLAAFTCLQEWCIH